MKPAPPPPTPPPFPEVDLTTNLPKARAIRYTRVSPGTPGARTSCDIGIPEQPNSPALIEKCRCKVKPSAVGQSLNFCEVRRVVSPLSHSRSSALFSRPHTGARFTQVGGIPDFIQRCIKATDNCKVDASSNTFYTCQCIDGVDMCVDKNFFAQRRPCAEKPGGANPPSCC